jgi:mannitol operon transcriptional antiterminator
MVAMFLTHRQRQIAELLLKRKEEITVREIAREINVSTRTIHRELAELETVIRRYGMELQKKSGIGILLQGEPESREKLEQTIVQMSRLDYSAEERRALLICMLLEAEEPVKLYSLAHDLRVTVPTVSHDLDELEARIRKANLTLVRRKGFGVQIIGPEANMREAIWQLSKDHLEDSYLFGDFSDRSLPPVTGRLLAMIGKDSLMQVEHALWQWSDELSERAYTDLLIRLSVAITRMRKGRVIESGFSGRAGPPSTDAPAAASLVKLLSETIHIIISPQEAEYISGLLVEGDEKADPLLSGQDHLSLMETVLKLICFIEDRMGMPLSRDRSLREGLLQDMEPALRRIKEGMPIRNSLLDQIKRDYERLFGFIREGIDELLPDVEVSDEEIGFLAMHFGASLERLKQFTRNVKAIIVCTSGLGSSKLLAVRLSKEFPQIEIVDHVSWYEAARFPDHMYDLIISTVELPLASDQYIKLSPLLTEGDIDKLREFVRDNVARSSSAKRPRPGFSDPTMEQLQIMKSYLDETLSLIERFHMHELESCADSPNLRETLLQIGKIVYQNGELDRAEHIDPIVEQLIERERRSSQVISDSQLALFHTISMHVRRPVLALFRLPAPMILNPDNPTAVRQLLLMLAPLALSREKLEILSEVSANLLLPEMIHVLESGSLEEMRQFLSNRLLEFVQTKLETGRTVL